MRSQCVHDCLDGLRQTAHGLCTHSLQFKRITAYHIVIAKSFAESSATATTAAAARTKSKLIDVYYGTFS